MIICVTGLAGAGKSLVAEQLRNLFAAEGIPVVQYNSDWVARHILYHKYNFNNPDFDYADEDLTTIYQTMYTFFEEILKSNPRTVIITDGMYRKTSQRLVPELIARKLTMPFKLLFIDTDPELTATRVAARAKSGGLGGWVAPQEYEYYFGPSVFRIDNNHSKQALAKQVQGIYQTLSC